MIRSSQRDCLSGYGVVTSGEAFKTSGVGVVHFSVSRFRDVRLYKPGVRNKNNTLIFFAVVYCIVSVRTIILEIAEWSLLKCVSD